MRKRTFSGACSKAQVENILSSVVRFALRACGSSTTQAPVSRSVIVVDAEHGHQRRYYSASLWTGQAANVPSLDAQFIGRRAFNERKRASSAAWRHASRTVAFCVIDCVS